MHYDGLRSVGFLRISPFLITFEGRNEAGGGLVV